MLRVNLIDVNDNSPQFERDEEIIWIGEETAVREGMEIN